MKDETFTELLGSANEALEHAQGKRSLRTTTLPLPPKSLNGRAVKRVRASLHASQAVFARYLNVSTKLVQAWEADPRYVDARNTRCNVRRRGQDPWGKQRAGFAAQTEIDRRKWGLRSNQALETGGVLVANKVKIEVEAQTVRQQDQETEAAGSASAGRTGA